MRVERRACAAIRRTRCRPTRSSTRRWGGARLLVGNAELRGPLFWRLSGVVFADAGNTFASGQPIRLNELGVGLGFGLRIKTPLAPIRIDLGFPRSFEKSGVRWHFSIGQMF